MLLHFSVNLFSTCSGGSFKSYGEKIQTPGATQTVCVPQSSGITVATVVAYSRRRRRRGRNSSEAFYSNMTHPFKCRSVYLDV